VLRAACAGGTSHSIGILSNADFAWYQVSAITATPPLKTRSRRRAPGPWVPKLRKGSYFPGFLEPRRLTEKALIAVVQEAYMHGVSTRSVDDLVKAMGMSGISKIQVSRRLCVEIDEKVKASRPIGWEIERLVVAI
jgi:hypothetical protein